MRTLAELFSAVGITAAMALAPNAVSAVDCKPSKWGAADTIGAANYVNPARVIAATKLVKKGESHPLGIVVEPGMPAFPPRSITLQVVAPGQHNGRELKQDFGWPIVYNDDISQLWWGIGPQIDGLGHLGEDNLYYNCLKAAEISHITGLKKLGTHDIPPMIGRGVLINMAKFYGMDVLPAGHNITADDLKAAASAQGVTHQEGDVILIHTGWTDGMLKSDPQAWVSGEPGPNNAAMVYLASLNPMAVGADTWGVEPIPPPEGDKVFYGHVTLLKENGIYILETMNTGRLAKEGVNEFMFVLGQARLKGAVQMIINPVAMW